MVQNEWNIYYCIYNMNHFIYIMKTTNVFNRFLLWIKEKRENKSYSTNFRFCNTNVYAMFIY